ncbi:MAG: PaaI family thioesterase [Candidatus Eremiobacteraeota bacterium]|nr:PaaI family thioesterase [Candidatus Eremiobacteraeota bacterium]
MLQSTDHPDQISARREWNKEKSFFVELLDLHLESVEKGRAVMRMPYRPEVTNGTGAIHGGAIVSLCDTCFYIALASIYGREQDTTTAALACNFLAPALPPHDLVAEATILKAGRRIVYGEVHVRSGDKLVAHATLNFLNSYSSEKPAK